MSAGRSTASCSTAVRSRTATVYRVLTPVRARRSREAQLRRRHGCIRAADRTHHDHMVCLATGRVIEFTTSESSSCNARSRTSTAMLIEEHSLVLYVRPKKP